MGKNNGWNEAKVKVTCVAAAVKGSFAVRVYTSLNSAANDESFAIDNAVLSKYVAPKFKTISTNFKDAKDMDGWNCVKVQNCGSLGSVCGGYNTKGKSHDIKKTFTKLPDGNYKISLDFIKIDSWDNEKAYVTVKGAFAVRVYTALNSAASDESFAIDNAVLTKA